MELSWREEGAGPPLLLLHESAATGAVWEPLIAALRGEARAIAPDRRGWGASEAPPQYRATTVEEQAADALALLGELDAGAAIACGSGLGAVIALELLLRHSDRVRAAVLVEPPLLAFLPEATEGLAADREAIGEGVQRGGPEAAADLYLGGGLPHLGPGAQRIPDPIAAAARERPLSLFAELGAVPGWSLRSAEMQELAAPSRIVVATSTPPLLRAAAERLAPRLGASSLVAIEGRGLPQIGGAEQLAGVVRELLEGG